VESIGRRSRLGGGQFRGSGNSIYRQGRWIGLSDLPVKFPIFLLFWPFLFFISAKISPNAWRRTC
jgi:hypothetical protein